jgi:hypothetical protein
VKFSAAAILLLIKLNCDKMKIQQKEDNIIAQSTKKLYAGFGTFMAMSLWSGMFSHTFL